MDIMGSQNADRVRANTAPEVNERIDREGRLAAEGTPASELTRRIEALEAEWSVERVLETEAASMGLLGLGLAQVVDRRFLALSGFVSSMLMLHGVQGWYPLLPVFRRLGARTRGEIDREKYALQERRGDTASIPDLLDRSRRQADRHDRVRRHSDSRGNLQVDQDIEARVLALAEQGPEAIEARLAELAREWDVERAIATNAGTLSLVGVGLSFLDRRWMALPATVYSFLLQHGVQGWCPPVPALRKLGFRTRGEIDREEHALRTLLRK